MHDIRIAAAVFNSIVNQPQDNLDRMVPLIHSAKKQGAKLICFPELNVTGYSTREAPGLAAETIPGPISRRLQQVANEYQIVILAGMAEKGRDGRIYASHLVATPQGLSGIYRKVHIAPPEREIFTAGSSAPVFQREEVSFSVQLCYDAHFPELATRMALDGAEIIFMPHASPRGTPTQKLNSWLRHLTARAFDNSVYIVACNQNGDNQKGLQFPGVAVVIDPSGLIINKDVTGRDGIIVTDLKSGALLDVRGHRMRYFLPNRRPDVYSAE